MRGLARSSESEESRDRKEGLLPSALILKGVGEFGSLKGAITSVFSIL
jgi:hypothetical protein